MNIQNILNFLSELKKNNDRAWFAENKSWYEQSKNDFEKITNVLIAEIAQFDEDIKNVQAKDCVFRIYRDTRFHDKTPYKTHMGTFIASHGGRKSPRSGYYFHLEPGNSLLSIGVWCPEPGLLKAIRTSVYENIDELKEILNAKDFKKYFNGFSDEGDTLKTAPKGFPKDFEDIDYLKLKHYVVNYNLPESLLRQENFIPEIAKIFKSTYPLGRFLNYAVDEFEGY